MEGLTIWRRRGVRGWSWLRVGERALWSETWHSTSEWIEALERSLTRARVPVLRPGPFEAWDLEVRGGLLGRSRLLMTTEEHGGGRQLVRFRVAPHVRALPILLVLLLAGIVTMPAAGELLLPSAFFFVGAAAFLGLAMLDVGCAEATILGSVTRVAEEMGSLVIDEEGAHAESSAAEAADTHAAPDADERASKSGERGSREETVRIEPQDRRSPRAAWAPRARGTLG
jgi:hypothetical protein